MFEVGAILGARRVIIGSIVDDESLCTAMFAKLCESGRTFNLDIALEFAGDGRDLSIRAGTESGKACLNRLVQMPL